MNRPLWDKLTPREQQIFGWMKYGWTMQQAGQELGISRNTVLRHVSHTLEKLGCANTTHAVTILLEEKHRAEIEALRNEQVLQPR